METLIRIPQILHIQVEISNNLAPAEDLQFGVDLDIKDTAQSTSKSSMIRLWVSGSIGLSRKSP